MIELPILSDITKDEYYIISKANWIEARERARCGEDEIIVDQEVIWLDERHYKMIVET
jgi:hypothetical protein